MPSPTLPQIPVLSLRAIAASICAQISVIGASCLAPKAAILLGRADMPLGEVNAYAMMAYGLFVAAIMIASTLSTSDDGQKMGRKFGSLWLPIKSILMISWLIPIPPESATWAQMIGKAIWPGLMG